MNKFRIVKTEYKDGDIDFSIQMNTSWDNYVLITSRKTIEEAREVCEFLNGRSIVIQEVVE
jgi:hypothetical protein